MDENKWAKVKLIKVDERPDAEVPNNICVSEYRIGYVRKELLEPLIGIRYGLEHVISINGRDVASNNYFITSTVVERISQWVFKTMNSIYKIELQ